MNLDKKLEIAQEYALIYLKEWCRDNVDFEDTDHLAESVFKLADSMEKEYIKRKIMSDNSEFGDIRRALHKGFGDKTPMVNTNFVQVADDFQIDWSVAPDDAVAWVYSNVDKSGFWCHKPPVKLSRGWCTSTMLNKAPSFNYQGDWKDSLRQRPQEKPKQHQCNCSHWKGCSTFMGETHTCSDCGGWVII